MRVKWAFTYLDLHQAFVCKELGDKAIHLTHSTESERRHRVEMFVKMKESVSKSATRLSLPLVFLFLSVWLIFFNIRSFNNSHLHELYNFSTHLKH